MTTPTCQPCYGPTNPSPDEQASMPFRRFASIIGLKPEKEQYYRELHADVWAPIIDRLRKSNMRNYSIYVAEIGGQKYLFSYLEYVGDDFDRDQRLIAEDPETQRWWRETAPCQFPLPSCPPGAKWTDLEMVFAMD